MAVMSADFIASVAKRIEQQRTTAGSPSEKPASTEERSDPYFEAAAVLAWYDPEQLKPTEAVADKSGLDLLLADSVRVIDSEGKQRWTISPGSRINTLRQLRTGGRLQQALAANKAPEQDPLQQSLTACLSGNAPALETQEIKSLSATYQVVGWLASAGFDKLPSRNYSPLCGVVTRV
jgi:hypothetical protein